MIWDLEFIIAGKKLKTKKNKFETFDLANNFAKKIANNVIKNKNKKVLAIIKQEKMKKEYRFTYHINGQMDSNLGNILKSHKSLRSSLSKRDFQKKKVYDWEEDIFGEVFFKSTMTNEQVFNFINKIIELEKAPQIEINIKEGKGACFFKYYENNEIDPLLILKKNWGLNRFVICHELAHYFIHLKEDIIEGDHSENYIGFYINLLSKYTNLDEDYLWRTARNKRIKFIKYPKNKYKSLII